MLLLLGMLGGVSWTSGPLLAKKPEAPVLPVPPPQPIPATATVRRGAKVEITLRAYGVIREGVRFLIRTPPARGRILGEPQLDGRGGAVVTYEPPANLAITTEKFTFAVQNAAGFSAPAEVGLTITDEPARLLVTDALTFAKILAGTSAGQELEIQNTGGSEARGEVQVEAPWRLEGLAAYRLAGGARQKWKLTFAPVAGGVFRGEVRYTSQLDRVTSLRGEAESPLGLEPGTLVLRHARDNPARSGTTELSNRTLSAIKLTVSAEARLQAPAELSVPAGDSIPLTVSMTPGDLGAIQAEITLQGEGLSVKVPVTGAEVLPILSVASSLTAGVFRWPASSASSAELSFENKGGASGFWKCEQGSAWSVVPAEFRLAPAAHQAVLLRRTSPPPATAWRESLRFIGEGQTVEVTITGEGAGVPPVTAPAGVTAMASAAGSSSYALATGAGSTSALNPVAPAAPAAADEAGGHFIPFTMVAGVQVVSRTAHAITLRFPRALIGGQPVRLEFRGLDLDENKTLSEHWYPLAKAQFRTEGDFMVVAADGLRADTIYTLGVALEATEPNAAPVFQIDVRTTPGRAFIRLTPWRVAALVSVALVTLLCWRRMRSRR